MVSVVLKNVVYIKNLINKKVAKLFYRHCAKKNNKFAN